MAKATDLTMLNLASLRINLKQLMNPKVLTYLSKFLEVTDDPNGSLLERFKTITETSQYGGDCKYAQMAKEFFLEEQSDKCAKAICWLYHNWARTYEK